MAEKINKDNMAKMGNPEVGILDSTLRGLTLKKVILIFLVFVVLKASWNMVNNLLFEPPPLELSDIEMGPDDFGFNGFKPQSCVMEDGVCKPFSEANVPVPTKGLYAFGDSFYLDGRPFRIFSGSFHYFRTHPSQWGDRLLRMRAAGLNTITSYIPWNMHEKNKGEFTYGGMYDLPNFIEQVHKVGLKLIIRPGPYICAEWEFGGLPSWLLHDPKMQVRSSAYGPYLTYVEEYFNKLFPMLSKFTYKRGGPIIAFQVENEYGSFSKDPEYLKFLVNLFNKWQLDELLFTSDGVTHLENGTLPGIFATANFVKNADENLKKLKNFQPNKPLMVTEFWSGWFDHWGEKHHSFDPAELQQSVKTILEMNASINFYMFTGGTNFGFWNGANYMKGIENYTGSLLAPTITSYDYDAPIGEDGDIKKKFKVIRQLILDYSLYPLDLPDIPVDPPKLSYGTVAMTQYLDFGTLLQHVPKPFIYRQTVFMENLPINNEGGQGYGWILYRTRLPPTRFLIIDGWALDRAHVFVNGQRCIVISYWDKYQTHFNVTVPNSIAATNTLDIFVENMGRINYERSSYSEPILNSQRKGFQGQVRTSEGALLKNWEHYPLEFTDMNIDTMRRSASWKTLQANVRTQFYGPTAFRGSFMVNSNRQEDTFIDMANWDKGIVVVNGFHLGRYWRLGPQRTLYVPGPILVEGTNDIIIFDTDMDIKEFTVTLTNQPMLS